MLGLWVGIAIAGLVFYYALSLPDTDDLWKVSQSPEISIYSVDDRLVARRGRRGGQALRFEDLPDHLVYAVVSIEDRRFFSHFGLDPRGLARAMWQNLKTGRVRQGGSTLTQQLAKNVFLTPNRTLKRKVQELLLAFWLEARLTKQDILALYFNRVYFGAGAYGVKAAAETYFNRPVQSLTRGEAAMLAGLLKAPSRYAPTRNPDAARQRALLVINAMRETGFYDTMTAQEVAAEQVRILNRSSDAAHYAVDWTLGQLPDFVGHPRSDLDVLTTIDPILQLAAEKSINKILNDQGEARNAGQAAMVVMTPDGAIRAMVGGRSYERSPFNRAVLANRQPGSAFKPIVYLAALETGFLPDDWFVDAPLTIGDWSPKNYDETFRGRMTMEQSLAKSTNTIAVQISEQIGRRKTIDMARRLGVTSRLREHPSIALGSFEVNLLELTTAYSHFANGGRQTIPYVINSVTTGSGAVLYERAASLAPPVTAAKHVGVLNQMLQTAVEEGSGRAARIKGLELAGKTGTSQNWRDAWFVGYGGSLVAGVWVGNDDGSPMNRVTGGGLPAQIWRDFMVTQKSMLDDVALPSDGTSGGGLGGMLDWLFGN
ncbi:PBP1A family penicillin-binding protein [Alphaproteobacteria bacterium]|nr:PBP1A family penicillin-binding protein [Alphaproteobacteria bacterium]